MTKSHPPEHADYYRFPVLCDLEILEANYYRHSFKKHAHDRYTVGIILEGAGGFHYRGRKCLTRKGHVTLLDPAEPHDGFVCGQQGWRYNTLYIQPAYVREVISGMRERDASDIHFGKTPALSDPEIHSLLRSLYVQLHSTIDLLAMETILQKVISMLAQRYAEHPIQQPRMGNLWGRMQRVCDFIQANFHQKIMLSDLSSVAGLSKYHLIRSFQSQVGMSPHDYLNQVRIGVVRDLLAKQKTIAAASLETGFFDQSHMSKTFKRVMGVTPGQYVKARNILQDPADEIA